MTGQPRDPPASSLPQHFAIFCKFLAKNLGVNYSQLQQTLRRVNDGEATGGVERGSQHGDWAGRS